MKKVCPFFPVLFCIFPIISLYAYNIDEISRGDLLRPLALVFAALLVLWVASGLALRDAGKAGMLVSFLLLWFFSYGHMEILLQKTPLQAGIEQHPMWLFLPWCLILAVVLFLLAKSRRPVTVWVPVLNIAAIALVAMPLYRIAACEAQRAVSTATPQAPEVAGVAGNQRLLPNIYYIILDGYARADTLKDVYGYDNRPFLDFLHKRNFQIPEQNLSNYSQTLLSLSSSLNYAYLDELLGKRIGPKTIDRLPLKDAISNNRVVAVLKQHGYTTVAFATGYDWSNVRGADIFVNEHSGLTSFDNLVVSLTPLALRFTSRDNPNTGDYLQHRKAILFPLNYVSHTTSLHSPIFVYSHILAPHPPFVFNRDGSPHQSTRKFSIADADDFRKSGGTEAEYLHDYREQLLFVNQKVRTMVTEILTCSHRPTIIILQSDHGPASHLQWGHPDESALKERMRNFIAVHFPRGDNVVIPDNLTPVNVFRIIFNHYFAMKLPLLDNQIDYSSWDQPYDFHDVTILSGGAGVAASGNLPAMTMPTQQELAAPSRR